ncbi:Voldacs domain-containing protein [Aspergillus ibericus CBS 121593]
METLTTPPDTTSFIPLAEHQSRTPSSFHSGPAVLYSHHQNCKLVILERDVLAIPALSALRGSPSTANGTSSTTDEDKEIVIEGVNVWVTSEKFLLHNPTTTSGLSIPYPTIHLHAIQRLRLPTSPEEEEQVQGLYMQLAHPSPAPYTSADDEEEPLIITIVPGPAITQQQQEDEVEEEEKEETPTQTLYAAVLACSNLHPDPVEDGDEDEGEEEGGLLQAGLVSMGSTEGGLPPPVEGSSGWITAENMHEFFDEEGNWIAGGEEPSLSLGPGAGTVRQREDGEGGEEEGVNGEGESEETKWRRTD